MVIRARADACPGVVAAHAAADGALARIRLPGGRVGAAALRVLADCAEELGDGAVHLTSRGNVQLRGLAEDTDELVARLVAAGLLPAPNHERVRNILASPLSGITGGLVDVRGVVDRLDAALCARPELAELPGRFLFALDDGRGDVSGEDADVCWRAVDAHTGVLLLAGADTGWRVPLRAAVAALVRVATAFRAVRGSAWRVRELPDPAALAAELPPTELPPTELPPLPAGLATPVGPVHRDDGGLGWCVAPLFGQFAADQVRLLAELSAEVVVTPWRSVVLPGVAAGAEHRLAAAGLLTDPAAPGLRVSACIGRPGCAKARADVRAHARQVLARLPEGEHVHFAGCARRCGAPRRPHHDVLAQDGGYLVDGTALVGVAALAASLTPKGEP
nr:precorrin-3B synthase [Goodfellowiella coeruleoviolacea]